MQQLFPEIHTLNLEAKFCSETPVEILVDSLSYTRGFKPSKHALNPESSIRLGKEPSYCLHQTYFTVVSGSLLRKTGNCFVF
jgi:hypothetical protein